MPPRHRFVFLLNSAQRRLQLWVATEQARLARGTEATPSPAQGGVLFVADNPSATLHKVSEIYSRIGFAVKHMMVSTVRGEFKSYTGTLERAG